MTSPRTVTDPQIPGWTVYRGPEWWEAISDADPGLVVRHMDPDVLTTACEAISRPPVRVTPTGGPLGGINV